MLWLALACHEGGPTPDGGTTGASDLPDPYADLDRAACEGGGLVTNTATAWFVGDLTLDGDTFAGTETAAVHWSPGWVDTCGYQADCTEVWQLTGSVGDPGACPDCDFSLAISATRALVASDCPVAHADDFGDAQWTSSYDVKLDDDGTTRVSYSEDGTPLGGWYWKGSRVEYVSDDPLCNPYPDDLSSLCD